jgi:hypothetical protein
MRFVAPLETQLELLLSPKHSQLPSLPLIEHAPPLNAPVGCSKCDQGSFEIAAHLLITPVYCSKECMQEAFESYHQILCWDLTDNQRESLKKFEKHAKLNVRSSRWN